MMGFIHNQVPIFGNDAASSPDIGQEQGMVDDDDMCGLSSTMGLVVRTDPASVKQAGLSAAFFSIRSQARPYRPFDRSPQADFGHVARTPSVEPYKNLCQNSGFLDGLGTQPSQRGEPPWAQIIPSALEHGSSEIHSDCRAQVWNVLVYQLVLQVDRIG